MDYFNHLTLFTNLALINVVIILVVILLSSIGIILALLQKVTKRSTDLFQYKVTNFYISYLYAGTYILGFILFLYGLRIYNVNRVIDLKEIYKDCCIIYNLFSEISFLLRIYISLLCIFLILIILLLFVNMHKYFIKHIYNLHLYVNSKPDKYRGRLWKHVWTLSWISDDDIISYMIYDISSKITKLTNGFDKDYNLPAYHPHKFFAKVKHRFYQRFVVLSPLIFVLYDCIFNDWVLTHVFYYLLVYIPLMLIKRITICLATEADDIATLLWQIFYEKERVFDIYETYKKRPYFYAISKENKSLLDLYLLNGLRRIFGEKDIGLDMQMYLRYTTLFVLNHLERETYMNDEGVCLKLLEDNRVFVQVEVVDYEKDYDDQISYTLGEEWILLANKPNKGT
jgi:hypothetical protein